MKIRFYVNGSPVDTYKCAACSMSELTPEDEQAIAKMKRDAYRNFGYPPVLVVEPSDPDTED